MFLDDECGPVEAMKRALAEIERNPKRLAQLNEIADAYNVTREEALWIVFRAGLEITEDQLRDPVGRAELRSEWAFRSLPFGRDPKED
jgi:hypothetical protein